MIKKIAIALALVIVVLCGVIATRPAESHIERSASMAAPAEVVFAVISDFHQWDNWSPWAKMDPNMKKTFEGPATGVGSIYSWVGNDQVGEGRMTMTDAKAPTQVVMKLEFFKPWQAVNTVTLTVAPSGTDSKVTWAMDGTNNFMMKAMGMFMNMDSMVGADFEKGLASLKELTETEAKKRATEAEAQAAAKAAADTAAPDAPPAP